MITDIDQFDRLPDAILRTIFNKLHDAQSLTRCGLVCKRFAAVSAEVDTVFLTIPRKRSFSTTAGRSPRTTTASGGYKNFFRSLVRKVVTRPLQFLLRMMKSSSNSVSDIDGSYYSPNAVLKNFNEIRFLQIQLPGHGDGVGLDGKETLLRWRGEFGSELESCVIVGANSLRTGDPNNGQLSDSDEVLLNDDQLKMRVVWTISCLIAASARHYLVRKVISEHQLVRNVAVVDGNRQGRLSMNPEQIEQLREKLDSSAAAKSDSSVMDRVEVPAVKMKLWYVPELELPETGRVMEGATLVVITPVVVAAGKKAESDGDVVWRAFGGGGESEEESEDEKIFGEAVKEMMKKKKSYTLEMNSF